MKWINRDIPAIPLATKPKKDIRIEAMTHKSSPKALSTAPRISDTELAELKKKMLANLADPEIAVQVDRAELELEEKMKEAASDLPQKTGCRTER